MPDSLIRLRRVLAVAGGLSVCAYLGFLAGSSFVRARNLARPAPFEQEAVIVFAAQDIKAYSQIVGSMIVLLPYPEDYVLEDMITQYTHAIDRWALVDIYRGMPITESMLSARGGSPTFESP